MTNRGIIFICIVVLLFFGTAPLHAQSAYEDEPFDGVLANPGWYTDHFGPLQWPLDGLGARAVRLDDCASSSATSFCTTSTSSYGQEAAISTETKVHAGFKCGSGDATHPPRPDCQMNEWGVGMHEETWYRFHIRLAPGFLATPQTQNSLMEFHVDSRTEADAKAHGGITAYSTTIEIIADGTKCPGSPAYCTVPGTNPRLFLQVPGGSTSCGTACLDRIFPFASNSLLVNHWYDFVLHMVWDASPTVGYVQWWVDGTKMVDKHTSTLYKRSDGTWSYGESMGLYNYRHWASWASAVDGEDFIWGPTASSINFNPTATGTATPSAPDVVTGADAVAPSTTISWTAASNASVSRYHVYRSTTSGSGYENVGTTSGLSFTDHTVQTGTTYYYVVTAIADGIESPSSSEIQVNVGTDR
jgi:Polysaccharide lyase